MNPYMAVGGVRDTGTAVLVGPNPGTTQQLGCDNSEITTMRAQVGGVACRASGYFLPGTL